MHDIELVELIECGDKMLEKKANLKHGELSLHRIVHKLLKVAITILIDDIDVRLADVDFADCYDIIVRESLKRLHLTHELFWDPILCLANLYFLQRDNCICSLIDSLVDL